MKRHIRPVTLFVLLLAAAWGTTACDTLEWGVYQTPTPVVIVATATTTEPAPSATPVETPDLLPPPTATATIEPAITPTATPTETPQEADWATFSSSFFAVSLQHPAYWQPVPGEAMRKLAGEDGFFILDAIGNPAATIDDIAQDQAGHKLLPYGSQPTIEPLHVQGQEARLILPSADATMSGQTMLIVRYPHPVQISGVTCEFFALYADQEHVRQIAQTLRFDLAAIPAATATPALPAVWRSRPPGLVYRLQNTLWLIDADEQAQFISNDPQAVLSPNGRQLLTTNPADGDPWLLDLATGNGRNLTNTPDYRVLLCLVAGQARDDPLELDTPKGRILPGTERLPDGGSHRRYGIPGAGCRARHRPRAVCTIAGRPDDRLRRRQHGLALSLG
ncbi:MAG: hypothetical protein JXA89_09975 [Anaerolineae bacterium]|nr:hypothetical protein [Anaerolineae bacterium]